MYWLIYVCMMLAGVGASIWGSIASHESDEGGYILVIGALTFCAGAMATMVKLVRQHAK